MVIAISGNNEEYVTLAAETTKELLSNFNCEIKSMKDMPNYRPNRQMFEGGEFDNWIITDCKTEQDMEVIEKYKGLSIYLCNPQGEWISNAFTAKFKYNAVMEKPLVSRLIKTILEEEKLIYPTEQEA